MKSRRVRTFVSLFTIAAMLLTFTPVNAAGNSLKEGDYVKFGTYLGGAILWRVVDFDEESDPLLLSDKVLTTKPYALYNHDAGFTERHWETSFIRTWLNSIGEEAQTKYVIEDDALSNPMNGHIWNYDLFVSEAGFLSSKNFTAAEVDILKESKQRDTLVGKYASEKEGGEQIFKQQDTDIAGYAALVKKAYYKYVTDKMFIMDAEQLNEVYQKFGNYVLTGASNEALQYDYYTTSDLVDGYFTYSNTKVPLEKPFDYTMYYTRNIYDRNTTDIFRYLIMSVESQNVGGIVPFFGHTTPDASGVRPACYIDMSKTAIASGSGTKDDPYRFNAKNIYNNAEVEKPAPVKVAIGVGTNPSSLLYVKYVTSTGFPFVDSANRTQVPLRQTMRLYGCKVEWDDVNKIATITENTTTVQVPIGEKYILRNGQKIETDTAAMVVNGRTYLPIRPVVEAFNGTVEWDSAAKTVIISKP